MKNIGIINKTITPFLTDGPILYPDKKTEKEMCFKRIKYGNIGQKWTEIIKPFQAPQKSVKIKILVNFNFNTTF